MRRPRRSKKSSVAPAPAPTLPKIEAPRSGALKEIYKKLVSANISNRISAFFEALQWWDAAQKYYLSNKSKLTPENVKRLTQASKSRNLAIGATTEQEKEAALIRCISLMEMIWKNENKLTFKPFYARYEESRAELERREAAASTKFQVVLDALNSAFKPLNLSFALVKSTNSGGLREYDGEGKILITIALAKVLNEKVRQEGLLPVLFSEARTAIMASGVEKVNDVDEPGGVKQTVNIGLALKSLPVAMEGILNYINTAPKGKIFKQFSGTLEASASVAAAKIPSVKTPRVSNGPTVRIARTSRVSSGGALVGGRYAPGTACAVLYERLEDQKVHPLSEVLKDLGVNNPKDRLKYLVKHGARNGKWNVVLQGNTVQMIVN